MGKLDRIDIERLKRKAEGYPLKLTHVAVMGFLFTVFAYFNWVASGPDIPYDVIWKLVKPFQAFPEAPLEQLIKSGWKESGVQFFLFPVIAIIGFEPLQLKILQVAIFALISPLIYLAVKKKFGSYIGMGIALMPITFRVLEMWRNGDMYLVFFSMFLFLYLYTRWHDSRDKKFLYSLGFIAGIGAYIHIIMLYYVAAFLVATIIVQHRSITSIRKDTALKTGLLFLIGASPLIIYTLMTGFDNFRIAWALKNFPGIEAALETRVSQFFKITAPGSPFANGANTFSPHIYTYLFLSGAVITLVRRRGLTYLLGAVILFPLLIFTPQGNLPIHQLLIILPFFIMIVAQNFQELKKIGLHRITPLIFVGIIFLTWGHMHVSNAHPGSVTTEEYRNFSELGIDGELATNHRKGYALTVFDKDTEGRILAPSNWSYKFFIPEENRITVEEAVRKNKRENLDLLLIYEGRCSKLFYNEPRCGYSTDRILEEGDFLKDSSYENMTVVMGTREIKGEREKTRYLLIRGQER